MTSKKKYIDVQFWSTPFWQLTTRLFSDNNTIINTNIKHTGYTYDTQKKIKIQPKKNKNIFYTCVHLYRSGVHLYMSSTTTYVAYFGKILACTPTVDSSVQDTVRLVPVLHTTCTRVYLRVSFIFYIYFFINSVNRGVYKVQIYQWQVYIIYKQWRYM